MALNNPSWTLLQLKKINEHKLYVYCVAARYVPSLYVFYQTIASYTFFLLTDDVDVEMCDEV